MFISEKAHLVELSISIAPHVTDLNCQASLKFLMIKWVFFKALAPHSNSSGVKSYLCIILDVGQELKALLLFQLHFCINKPLFGVIYITAG